MLGATHFVAGMASALVIVQPQTVPEIITTITAGSIGGWIVDIDVKNRDISRSDEQRQERVFDAIIGFLFILAFIVVDFLVGKGMCQYALENWGIKVWGGLIGLLALLIVGFNTKHRTFTHSFLALGLFFAAMYFFCKPAATPFLIGYASHLVLDILNIRGLQLLFPAKKTFSFGFCKADSKPNKVLYWIALAIDVILGAFLFSQAMQGLEETEFITFITSKVFGVNLIQIYLVLINIVTFVAFQKDYHAYLIDPTETSVTRFKTWLLDLLAFLGGGLGMCLSFIINREIPLGYNANWWAFCYSSILFWLTTYLYICKPLGCNTNELIWMGSKHVPLLIYLVTINLIGALVVYLTRKKKLGEANRIHTLIIIIGALGGVVGAMPVVILTHHTEKFFYVISGFFIMLLSQIVFVMYMLSVGFL